MRILFLNQYFPPDASATAYLLGELTEDLARHHSVQVVAGKPSYNPESSTFVPKRVRVHRAWSTSFARGSMRGRLLNYLSFLVSGAAKAIKVPRPDVIVAMTDPPVVGALGLLLSRVHRSRFVYVCADVFPDVGIALGQFDQPLLVSGWRRLNRALWRSADRIVAVGRDMAENLIAQGADPARVVFIPNWGSEARPDRDEIAAIRRARGWDDKFVVMHAGNLGLAQNLDPLIQAADRLKHVDEIRFAFVGDGAARPRLEHESNRRRLTNVEFIPYQPKDMVTPLLASANLHVVSLARGLKGAAVPSKTYGILALGKPFVAAVEPNSEVHRIVRESGAGIRTEPGDVAGLVDAIEAFRSGSSDAAQAGARGRGEFERRYRRTVVTDQYRELLEGVSTPRS